MVRRLAATVLVALAVLSPSRSSAARFDFIVADEITMTAPLADWGIMLGSYGFGLLVNKGTTSLDADALAAAEFRVDGVPVWPDTTTPPINPVLRPGFNEGYLYHSSFQPIVPNEAAGSVGPPNAVLPPLVGPEETFRNTAPTQFIYFFLGGTGNSPGRYRFDVHLRIGGDEAHFPMFVTLVEGSYNIEFTHASRVSSAAMVTAARTTTWGGLKKLYR